MLDGAKTMLDSVAGVAGEDAGEIDAEELELYNDGIEDVALIGEAREASSEEVFLTNCRTFGLGRNADIAIGFRVTTTGAALLGSSAMSIMCVP